HRHFVAAGDPGAADLAAVEPAQELFEVEALVAEVADHRFDAAPVRALFGPDGEAALESLVFPDDRNRSQGQHGLRIDAANVLGQQVSFFDSQMRRQYGRQPAGDGKLTVQFRGQRRPLDGRVNLPLAAPRADLARLVVNVMKAVAPLVAHPPLVDVRVLARLQTVNAVLVLFDEDRAAGRTAGADARVFLHEPDALLI